VLLGDEPIELLACPKVMGVHLAIDRDPWSQKHVLFAFQHPAFVPRDSARSPRMLTWASAALRQLAPEWLD
jgi:hypothetical protein